MLRIYKTILFTAFFFFAANLLFAQVPAVSVNPALTEMYESKIPQKYTIAGIEVKGTRTFDANLIISISGIALGDIVNIPGTDVFNKALVKLWKQNLISDAEIFITKLEGTNIFIEIAIVERPRLLDFDFIGVKKGDKDDLTTKTNISKDRVLTEDMKISAVNIVKKFYIDKGYGNVTVRMEETVLGQSTNGVKLNFYIVKGKKVKINSINFANNEEVADAKLKKQMKGTKEMTKLSLYPDKIISPYGDTAKSTTFKDYLNEAGYLYPTKTKEYLDRYFRIKFFAGSKFSEKKFGEDKEKILNYYNAQGFRDADIVDYKVIPNDKGNLDVHIKVTEGHKYYFGNIAWKGATKYPDSLLSVILGIKKGDIYNGETLNKRLGKQLSADGGDIGSYYQDDGYLYFNVDPIETAVYNDTIDFEIQIREGPQFNYGKITVSGNDKTKDYVILRELRTIPGEKFSRQDIIRTQRELSQLGFLDPEKINPQVVPNPGDGTVDINWQVAEKSGNQVELSAGFGGGIGLTGTLGFTFNNFSLKNALRNKWDPIPEGDGQKLSIRAQSNGRAFRSYNFSFTEPWLGGKKRNSLSISYFNTRQSNAFDQFTGAPCRSCGKNSYLVNAGVGIALGKQLKWPDDFFNLIYSLNIQQYRLKDFPRLFPGLKDGTSTNINSKITLVRNSAGPNPIFPTGGSNVLASVQFTLPYSLLGISSGAENQFKLPEFHKWRFTSEWYVPIGRARGAEKNKQFILKLAAKYGFIGRYNRNLNVSPFERFQVGDAGLNNAQALLGFDIIAHRGYPIYASSDPKINPDGVNQDQFFTIFNKYTTELRYPFSTSASSTIYGLAFYEAANGWYSFKDYNPFKLRRSVGVGMRFFLPMFGLLGFDYGLGLDRYNQNTGIKGAAKFTFMLGQEPE